jgi:ZIP family zinc transporter
MEGALQDSGLLWGLLLSSLAGGSTAIGGAIGVLKKPNDSHLAFLLGVAIGVMMLLAVLEMWIHNALEHGPAAVTVAFVLGAGAYRLLQPLLPDSATYVLETKSSANLDDDKDGSTAAKETVLAAMRSSSKKVRSAELFRLGLLMSLTMTLHNFPEGFAVAFSSLTDFGPIMALAIAIHNIPEGIIVAAPVYAATGCRWKALGMAALSGVSEPIGALIALLSVKPIISEDSLHVILAAVGGIMGAVCVLELWPEAKKCKADRNLGFGILFGALLMGSTLLVGV